MWCCEKLRHPRWVVSQRLNRKSQRKKKAFRLVWITCHWTRKKSPLHMMPHRFQRIIISSKWMNSETLELNWQKKKKTNWTRSSRVLQMQWKRLWVIVRPMKSVLANILTQKLDAVSKAILADWNTWCYWKVSNPSPFVEDEIHLNNGLILGLIWKYVCFPDGWTRDRQKSTQLITDYLPLVGSTVKVCVTCVLSPDEFYAHIPEIFVFFGFGSIKDLKASLNADNMIKQYEPFVGIPGVWRNGLKLVYVYWYFAFLFRFSRFGVGFARKRLLPRFGCRQSWNPKISHTVCWLWLRGWNWTQRHLQVASILGSCTRFNHFHVDQLVLFELFNLIDLLAQSHRCKLANVRVRDDKMPKAMQMFKDMVINKDNVFAKIM